MSRLDELIKELCPNGVEYKELGEIVKSQRGKTITKELIKDGDIPVISGGQKPAYYHNESNRKGEVITVAGSGAYAGFVMYWDKPIFVSDAFSIECDKSYLNIKYIYYFLQNNQMKIHSLKKGGGVPHVYFKDMQKFLVPVPPLEVQDEIVKILDNYTKSVEELKEKLNEELTARKKQYSWYRDYLLKFENKVEKSKLSEVATIKARIGWQGLTKEEYLITGNYYLITGTDFQNGEINLKNCYYVNEERYIQDKNIQLKNDDVLVTKDGTLGKVAYVSNLDKPATLNSGIFVIRSIDTNKLLNRYLFHYLKAPYLMKYAQNKLTGGTIKHLNQNVIVDFEIPLPPLEVQKRIVEVLDNFEKICNDLNIGLPAEIEARQKQYEFYRNFLLTFKEDSVNSLRQDKTRQDKIYIDS